MEYPIRNDNGLTLQQIVEFADQYAINPEKVYLLQADGNPITVATFDEDVPELWYLGDDEGEF